MIQPFLVLPLYTHSVFIGMSYISLYSLSRRPGTVRSTQHKVTTLGETTSLLVELKVTDVLLSTRYRPWLNSWSSHNRVTPECHREAPSTRIRGTKNLLFEVRCRDQSPSRSTRVDGRSGTLLDVEKWVPRRLHRTNPTVDDHYRRWEYKSFLPRQWRDLSKQLITSWILRRSTTEERVPIHWGSVVREVERLSPAPPDVPPCRSENEAETEMRLVENLISISGSSTPRETSTKTWDYDKIRFIKDKLL